MIRAYKYRLAPTLMQETCLNKTGRLTRFLWNRLVKTQQDALEDIKNGRRTTIENEYKSFLVGKSLTGKRVISINKLSIKKNISSQDALNQLITDAYNKDINILIRKEDNSRGKKGTRALNYSAQHLSWRYAVEKVNSQRKSLISPRCKAIWTGLQTKWIQFGESLDKYIMRSPRFKKYGEISAIQKQVKNFCPGDTINLSWCGSECLKQVSIIYHRPIPTGGIVKQVALVKDSLNHWFVCLFVEAEDSVFARDFPKTDKTVGVDPGMKIALTTSDGEKFTPEGMSGEKRKMRKLARLQRKLQRQSQSNNSQFFDEQGKWKKKKDKSWHNSKGMIQTALEICDIRRHEKDARSDFYHKKAIKLLQDYDIIGVGEAQMHVLASLGKKGQAKRQANLKSSEHAIADFVSKLKDKAKLSLTPKQVFGKIDESYTTQRCSGCKELTGPKGRDELDIRYWKCSICGMEHDRDVNAAKNIRDNTISEMKAAAAQSVSGVTTPKVHKSTKGKVAGRSRPRFMESIVVQTDGLKSATFTNAQVMTQVSSTSRGLEVPVTLGVTSVEQEIQKSLPYEKGACSQSSLAVIAVQGLTQAESQ